MSQCYRAAPASPPAGASQMFVVENELQQNGVNRQARSNVLPCDLLQRPVSPIFSEAAGKLLFFFFEPGGEVFCAMRVAGELSFEELLAQLVDLLDKPGIVGAACQQGPPPISRDAFENGSLERQHGLGSERTVAQRGRE